MSTAQMKANNLHWRNFHTCTTTWEFIGFCNNAMHWYYHCEIVIHLFAALYSHRHCLLSHFIRILNGIESHWNITTTASFPSSERDMPLYRQPFLLIIAWRLMHRAASYCRQAIWRTAWATVMFLHWPAQSHYISARGLHISADADTVYWISQIHHHTASMPNYCHHTRNNNVNENAMNINNFEEFGMS